MNGTGDRREIEALIQGYLDGSLTEIDGDRLLAALRREPEYVEVILDGLRTDCLIRTVVAETADAGEMIQGGAPEITSRCVPQNRAPKAGCVTPCAPGHDSELLSSGDGAHGVTRPAFTARRWPQALAFAASVALLLGLGLWLFGPTAGEPVLAEVRGDGASIERGTGYIRASAGTRLQATDVLRTGTNGGATVSFGLEKTKIEVGADAQLKLTSLRKGKRFELRAGKIEATVTRQRPFRPLLVRTSQAEARVLGTRFMLAATTAATRLDVSEGKVRLTRSSDGTHVDVAKDQNATAPGGADWTALPKTSGLLREIWTKIPGGEVNDLLDHPRYPNQPAHRDLLKTFETPIIETNNYACRLIGYIHPPVTGDYTFWIASGGYSSLWLSPDENPIGKVRIATAPGGLPRQWWDASTKQHGLMMPQSPKIRLVAGRRYFIQAVEKATTNSSHLEVAWKIPGAEREIVSGEFLSPFKPRN